MDADKLAFRSPAIVVFPMAAVEAGLRGELIEAAKIEASIALGKSVGVTSTPTLFINGRNFPGAASVDVLKKVVEFQASQN